MSGRETRRDHRVGFALAGALVTLSASLVHAEDCTHPITQLALNQCAAETLMATEAELNSLYEEIRQRLKSDPDIALLFETAQRNWTAFRDAECGFAAKSVEAGSVYPLIYLDCLNQLSQDREDRLRYYLSCEEGDLACPVPSGN
jgi:uncharacterized protein YecT (DUF1311 family)